MNLVNYINENTGMQRGDEIHNSFVRLLSWEEILERLGINPPYHAMGFEVSVSNGGRRKCDLMVLNHELSIIEAKVIRSLNPGTETTRKKQLNKQLLRDHNFFNKKTRDTKIRLIGAYKNHGDNFFNWYELPPSGLNVDSLEILQISC